ncbi:MAG TPA: YchF-related putative GTPase [Candidatus Norongarragalinales archaeon]|nr:YchF-related putative GTPase [Candidatus Norongarragalinales archaeon]
MLIAIIGAPNKGKSTLFNALTLGNAAVANYPFTTIDPNKGVAYCSKECPHVRLGRQCDPNNSKCENGIRKIPINILDVAGLVEGASEGKGMGNQFLSDVAAADCAILVADVSGGSDDAGNICPPGTHDPINDVLLIESELDFWYAEVLKRNAQKAKGKKFEDFAALLSGLRISIEDLRHGAMDLELGEEKFWEWSKAECGELAQIIRKKTKPIAIAANKIDSEFGQKNVAALRERFSAYPVFPVAADSELALRKASQKGLIKYVGKSFELMVGQSAPEPILNALSKIRHTVIDKFGSTGVQELVDYCAFSLLDQIVVYPVEDEMHFSNHFGKVLPDAILLKRGSKAGDMAGKIHSDLATHMLYAVDAEKKMRISKDTELHDGQIVKIVSTR